MKLRTTLAAIPLMLGLAFAASEVSAALCFGGEAGTTASGPELDLGPNGPTTDDVKFSTSGALESANDCSAVYNPPDQFKPEAEEELVNSIWGPGFEHIAKAEQENSFEDSGSLGDLTLTVKQLSDGNWELEISGFDPGEAIELDFVALFKQSNGVGLWLFNDVEFSDADGDGTGTFVLRWCSGNPPDQEEEAPFCAQTQTSHLSILAGEPDDITRTPEPASLLLLGLGLAGLALTQRRRRRV